MKKICWTASIWDTLACLLNTLCSLTIGVSLLLNLILKKSREAKFSMIFLWLQVPIRSRCLALTSLLLMRALMISIRSTKIVEISSILLIQMHWGKLLDKVVILSSIWIPRTLKGQRSQVVQFTMIPLRQSICLVKTMTEESNRVC